MVQQQRHRGLSLIEVMMAGVVLVLMATAALPSWRNWVQQGRLLGASRELVADLRYLQSEAEKRNNDLRISFLPHPAGSCYVLHTGSASSCSCFHAGGAQCRPPAEVLKTTFRPARENVAIESNTASMLYSIRFGSFTPTGTIRIRAANGMALQHRLNLKGRIRTCAEGSPLLGHPAC